MNQDFQIRHGSKHYRPCNQYKHRFHRSHHRSLLGGQSVNFDDPTRTGVFSMIWPLAIDRRVLRLMILNFFDLNVSDFAAFSGG